MKNLKAGFAPIADINAKILILGTMPGEESLKQNEYYANTRNSFWRIMAALFEFRQDSSYEERTNILKKRGIALWDVMRFCERQGSLDSAIQDNTIVENDFVSFYRLHPSIKSVFFNGSKAEREYFKRVLPRSNKKAKDLEYYKLPSTSGAMTRLSYDEKLLEWSKLKGKHNQGTHRVSNKSAFVPVMPPNPVTIEMDKMKLHSEFSFQEWITLTKEEKNYVYSHYWNPYDDKLGTGTRREILEQFKKDYEDISQKSLAIGFGHFDWSGDYMIYIVLYNSKQNVPRWYAGIPINKGVVKKELNQQRYIVEWRYGGGDWECLVTNGKIEVKKYTGRK